MTALRVFLARVLDLIFRRRRDERFSAEVQTHLELLTEENLAKGMSIADARSAARRTFGGVDQMTAAYRDQRGLPFVDALGLDLRLAFRLLVRDPGFTATAVCVLGLGIGVNNMLVTILYAHTLRGLPIDRPDRVAYVSTIDARNADRGLSYQDFQDLSVAVRTLSSLAAFADAPVVIGDEERAPDRIDGTFLTANAFATIGVEPELGRRFVSADDRPGAPAVVILGSAIWKSRYGGDANILHRSILINGTPATVVGVVPSHSGFPSTAEVWLPLSRLPGLARDKRDVRTLRVFGRLRDGVSLTEGRSELVSIVDRLAHDHPETSKGIRARVVAINERYLGRVTDPAWLAFTTVGFLVVVISCANVANLMLDRSLRRAREIAIRASLGASRIRIVRQLLIEACVLAAIGGLLGLGVTLAGVRLFRTAIPANVLPYWFDYSMDARVFGALVTVSFATVLVFGLVPALSASKTDVNRVLKDGGTSTARHHAQRWTMAFLSVEYALTVVMLANLALGFRVSRPPLPSDTAIDTPDVLTASITLPAETYRTPAQRLEFYQRVEEQLRVIPAVSAASVASALPFMGATERGLELEGRTGENSPSVWTVAIGPRYFETLGLALIRGREFSEEDGTAAQPNAIVSERFVQIHFPDRSPLGERIALAGPSGAEGNRELFTIIGVAPALRHRRGPDPDPVVYRPFRAALPGTAVLMVRSRSEAGTLAPQLREEVRALDRNLPLYRVQTMSQAIADAQWNGRLSSRLMTILACLALGLSTIG
ncbi:MAG: ABC transporter permease, partial [Acidobacteria bacterium]|nr:ABC transporter permease [Acidobacteriota bacterium]